MDRFSIPTTSIPHLKTHWQPFVALDTLSMKLAAWPGPFCSLKSNKLTKKSFQKIVKTNICVLLNVALALCGSPASPQRTSVAFQLSGNTIEFNSEAKGK